MEVSNNEKDKEFTKQKLLNAVGIVINKDGFEKIGVNAVAAEAQVSKILIYRYFGSLDNMIIEYLSKNDFWISFSIDLPKDDNLKGFLKNMFRGQIKQMREDKLMQRLHRWELNTQNSVIEKLRLKREAKGITLITIISQLAQHPQEEVAALATILSASITYLSLLGEYCPMYNGIDLQSEAGWEQIAKGVDLIIDVWYDKQMDKK
ncbi:TetR/AcrR family transcriptional regulator [Dysgonomonas macrotermitis]|uniref:Transcriptional regulator, TetR family n=1 Tax=Dysgonomonas macrotermitis TaxID=1346286 RepID=A0A1M5AI55_9BACT|nr:TetR/AcrR family transcriptional regulator [Dysgonomonas macrotermitis]SHF29816.1 transcriptional regulator, TetR family [Dysgonomonas macrotermitis]